MSSLSDKEINEKEKELTEEKASESGLYEELEQVRVLFEETLRKETERAENPEEDEEQEKNGDRTEEAFVSEEEERLCARCESAPVPENECYCESCRKNMLRTRVKFRGFAAIILAVIIFFGSLVTSMDAVMDFYDSSSTEYEDFFEGYTAYAENKPVTAAAYYSSYLDKRQGSENISATALEQLIDSYCRMGEYPYAAEIINEYYNENALKLPSNKKYREIVEKNELYGTTYNAIVEIVQKSYGEEGYDYEGIVSEMKTLKGETDSDGKVLYSDYVIDIFVFDFTVPTEKDISVLYEMLKEIDGRYGREEFDHIPLLCKYAALCGDSETASEAYERMMKTNTQNMSAYGGYFNSIRYAESPDPDKLLEICHRMSEVSAELYACKRYNFDYLYYYAVAYMIKGEEGELPFTFMQQLYDSINIFGESYEGNARATDIFNMYAIAAVYTGNSEAYEWAKSELEYLGLSLSDAVTEYEKGNISVKEILTDREGGLS